MAGPLVGERCLNDLTRVNLGCPPPVERVCSLRRRRDSQLPALSIMQVYLPSPPSRQALRSDRSTSFWLCCHRLPHSMFAPSSCAASRKVSISTLPSQHCNTCPLRPQHTRVCISSHLISSMWPSLRHDHRLAISNRFAISNAMPHVLSRAVHPSRLTSVCGRV